MFWGRNRSDHRCCGGKGALLTEKGNREWSTEKYAHPQRGKPIPSGTAEQTIKADFQEFFTMKGKSKTGVLEVPGVATVESRGQSNDPVEKDGRQGRGRQHNLRISWDGLGKMVPPT